MSAEIPEIGYLFPVVCWTLIEQFVKGVLFIPFTLLHAFLKSYLGQDQGNIFK